ncbi:M15 family peptidase, partial [Patescibacteria group bacterium]
GLDVWSKIECHANPTTAPFASQSDRNVGGSNVVTGGTGTGGTTTSNPDDRLEGVHPDLVCLVNAAHRYSSIPFQVTSGHRESSSTAGDSRHLYGLAVDAHPIINGVVDNSHGSGMRDGNAPPNANYRAINAAFTRARQDCNNVQFQWGGSSPTFMGGRYYDSMHFQLPRNQYPNR